MLKKYQKQCPKCKSIIYYKRKNALVKGIKRNSICKKCYKNKSTNPNNKICSQCKRDIPKIDFTKLKMSKDGYACCCRKCMAKTNKKFRNKYAKQQLERAKIYRVNNKAIIS